MLDSPKRYVGMDVHKKFVVLAMVNAQQQLVLPPQRFRMSTFDAWCKRHLKPSDAVVLEASTNVWDLYDRLEPQVAEVQVAHPHKVKLIAASFVKTDKRDAIALARLLAAGMVPQVWVPPPPVRQLRSLINHRQNLVKASTAAKNRLHGILHRHNIPSPGKTIFAAKSRSWWQDLSLSPVEQLQVQHELRSIEHVQSLLSDANNLLAQLSVDARWFPMASRLIQLPGISVINAMTILSAIGDITRFATPQQLVGYAGLGARIRASGSMQYQGRITKQGRQELRHTLVEAAWVAVTCSPIWEARFQSLARRIGREKAIVAMARKLLVVIWQVLTQQTLDRFADPAMVGRAFRKWAATGRAARTRGVSHRQFVQIAFQQLGVDDVASIA